MAEYTPLARVRQHFRQLQNDRRSWEPFWRDVQEYIAPQRGRGLLSSNANEVNNGERRDAKRVCRISGENQPKILHQSQAGTPKITR